MIGTKELHRNNIAVIQFDSLISDLTASSEQLKAVIHKSTRQEIRRSNSDGIIVKQYSSSELLDDDVMIGKFAKLYMTNYYLKGLKANDPSTLIKTMVKNSGLVLTAAYCEDQILAAHVYVVDNQNARLWMSASCFRESDDNAFRQKVGRANKRLHFEDLLYFKQTGRLSYDWGGVSSLDNPGGITKLKMSFGGTPISYYDETIICSKRYKAFYSIRKCLRKLFKK